MAEQPRHRGPWTHRALVWIFSIAFGCLLYWFLSFVVNDIATWPPPDFQEFSKLRISSNLASEKQTVDTEHADVARQIAERSERQTLLRDSTQSSQQTMNQLLSNQRLGLEKEVKPTEAEQAALADAVQVFLKNQKAYQELNLEIVDLRSRQNALTVQLKDVDKKRAEEDARIAKEYEPIFQQHLLKLAVAKLAFLLPLVALAGWLFLRTRKSIYAPLVYAFGIAVALKATVVMHDHFPALIFKYMMIVVALLIVLRILVYLLRMIAQPSRDYLVRQYREAYERFFCPICDYPIRRGPLKYVFWSRRTIKKLHFPPQAGQPPVDEPYTCPACATPLYVKCESCGQIRHSLLPACEHCGREATAVALAKG